MYGMNSSISRTGSGCCVRNTHVCFFPPCLHLYLVLLCQIQDARNHVNQALQLLSSHDESYHFKTGTEVNKVGVFAFLTQKYFVILSTDHLRFLRMPQLMDAVMLQLTRARNRLTTPASLTLPELATSGLMVLGIRQ